MKNPLWIRILLDFTVMDFFNPDWSTQGQKMDLKSNPIQIQHKNDLKSDFLKKLHLKSGGKFTVHFIYRQLHSTLPIISLLLIYFLMFYNIKIWIWEIKKCVTPVNNWSYGLLFFCLYLTHFFDVLPSILIIKRINNEWFLIIF